MKYAIKSLKRHTVVPRVSGYYILKYQVVDNGEFLQSGVAKIYYRVNKYLICTEDSNNFKYFGPCDMSIFSSSMYQRYTYFSRISIRKTTLWENEIAAIKEYVLNGVTESNGCTINDQTLILTNGKYEIPLGWCDYNLKDPAILNMRKRHVTLSFIKDFHNITPVEEDLGRDFKNDGIIKFTCPICTNEKSPAGYLKMPKVFYKNNREKIYRFLSTNDRPKVSLLISDPNYILPEAYVYARLGEIFPNLVLTEKHLTKLCKVSNYSVTYMYCDYYTMFKDMYPNTEPVSIFDVKDTEQIYTLHNSLVDIYKVNKDKIVLEKYLKVKETFPKYEFSDENFTIFYPKTVEDIAIEGSNLHHCVGSYINKINSERNIILFLRKNGELDKSFVTVDIIPTKGGFEIEQAHGKYNCKINEIPGVSEFIEKWAEKFNIVINNLNKIC